MVVKMHSISEGKDVIVAGQDLANERDLDKVKASGTLNPQELEEMIASKK